MGARISFSQICELNCPRTIRLTGRNQKALWATRDAEGKGASSTTSATWLGAPFVVLRLGDGLVLLPEQKRFEELCEEIGSAITSAGLTPQAILATLPEARKRVFARHYTKSDSSKKLSRRQSRGQREK
jgi:hypothetical protein